MMNEITDKTEKILLNDKNFKKFINDDKVQNKQLPICIASFPRSGNTMIRTIYENVTLTYTGDDMIVMEDENEIQVNLCRYGIGVHNNIKNVFLIKTHFPNFTFPLNEFKSQGAILIVRNPFDTIDSFFELAVTDTHDVKLPEEERSREECKLKFKKFIKWVTPQYNDFHQYWINNLSNFPVKVFKYEDFTNNKELRTQELFEFLFKFKADKAYFGDLSEEEIKEKTKLTELVNSNSYKPGTGAKHYISLEKNRYDQEDLDEIIDLNYNVLSYFGYIEEFKSLNYENLKLAIKKKESIIELNSKTKDISKVNESSGKNILSYLTINDKSANFYNNYDDIVAKFQS